jgi:dUTP pyrophosphatase
MNVEPVTDVGETATAELTVGRITFGRDAATPPSYDSLVVKTTELKQLQTEASINVQVYKTHPDAKLPEYATAGSSCFDLSACITKDVLLKGFNAKNNPMARTPARFAGEDKLMVFLEPGERLLVPVGLIFDLPEGTTLKLYPRSGLSLKKGLRLANGTGIIDSDYIEPTFAIMENGSEVSVSISHGERICQGEVVVNPPRTSFKVTEEKPTQKTTRQGGFGHTGSH